MSDSILVAVDVETTGFRPISDRVVEVGAVKFAPGGEVLGRFSSLVNPLRPCSAKAYEAHGIADEELERAPLAAEVLARLAEFVGFDVMTRMVGHNLGFDRNFLHAEYGRAAGLRIPNAISNPVDTLPLARRAFPGRESYKLGDLAADFGWSTAGLHRAAADAERARLLWLACEERLAGMPPAWECTCACHQPGIAMLHCAPCCYPCSRCGRRVKAGIRGHECRPAPSV